ncbi:hypothetical protein H8356DRAFT_942129 [Neocallimastix lanati (nom. inval.)]|jgi:hypothetical protein|uniref:Uncharacterized protein n=1 Tax=Neocallimastix californiae TaxID=1754190 RepID=A0A1Y1ZUI3_9FUNG|nr:hypothetical protein H8356DRAFT_942129 [Neocallimastix sp. JGI-2020a]ORY13882.1 hypothetical protein LY90DRAFT_677680 [Neocallimastix californiae]|eukprot:ORY13882.1 hypothetical protein LY90DRAFT_677680 [Neocallimastix californiae]
MSNVQIRGGSLMNCAFSLLKHSIPSVSKTSLNNFLLSQKRNKSTNLDKDLAQNFFFSQHRPVLFNDMKLEFEIQSLQNQKDKVIEPVPFSSSIPKQCKSFSEMKYSNPGMTDLDRSEEEKSQILAAWDILDCMFTGRTSSSNAYSKEEESMSSSTVVTPQPLKSISEDTFLSCVNNSLYQQQQDDDIDIDVLFHQLFKNNSSKSSKNSSSSSNTSSTPINSKETMKK